ncbi:MAG TPA: alpha-amlyase, partial [Flavobacteriales bacterium]|nr:alpha-amlyase [Flavobacteriales bacterium]
VYMNQGKTAINTTDYLLQASDLDSVAKSSSYTIEISQNRDTINIIPKQSFKPIENLRLYAAGNYMDVSLFKSTKKPVSFNLPKKKFKQQPGFKSQINGWQVEPMKDNDSVWTYKTNLDPGNYQYLFVVNDREIRDLNNKDSISNGMGGYNSLLQIDDHQKDKAFLNLATQSGNRFTIDIQKPVDKVLVYLGNQKLSSDLIKLTPEQITIDIPKSNKKRAYLRVYAYNKFGRSNDLLIPLHKGKIITNTADLNRHDFHTQIMYFLMVDRFKDGDQLNNRPVKDDSVLPKVNFKGGDIQGVDQVLKKSYFKDLGINTLWLSPILKNPEGAYGFWPNPPTKFSGYHGYWPVSNIKIDDRFGNPDALKDLLKEAHQQNMNVLLDYVANHVHKNHPLYKQHPDWFTSLYLPDGTMNTEKWDSHRLTTWFDTFLPTIDFSKHDVVEKMTDSAMYWLQQYDIDGFRHDATKHIQLDYWRTLTHKIKNKIARPVYQIGETYGSPQLIRSYVNSGMLDGQFNFNLYDASVAVFAKDNEPVKRLADAMQEALTYYGDHNLMGNITGNQDRVRFISYASGDVKFDEDGKMAGWTRKIGLSDTTAYHKLEMLHAFNLCIPGIPCIYYGDEYGMPGANDPDNRRMMQFENLDQHQQNLKNKVRELIHLRKNSMALLYGITQVETKGNLLIIKRQYFDDKVTLMINKSDNPMNYQGQEIPANDYKIIKQ